MSSNSHSIQDEISDAFDSSDNTATEEDALTSAKTRRMLARRKLEEKEEMRRLRYEINDPLFDF